MLDQILISLTIVIVLICFLKGKWRYEVIAMTALFAIAILGLLSVDEMFAGFIHPIVILIVSMLIISKGLISSGVIDLIARHLKFADQHFLVQLGILTIFTAFLSAFINSMGALAFLIPIAMKMSRSSGKPLSLFLMPIAFASHFGGSTTLIGSVSNIVVSGFRADQTAPFAFFDFAYVALPIVIVSIIFTVTIGWRLVPKNKDFFMGSALTDNYITEIKITEKSPVAGKTIDEFRSFTKEYFSIFSLVRDEQKIPDPSPFVILQEGDILLIETGTESLESIVTIAQVELLNTRPLEEEEKSGDIKDLQINRAVVTASSPLIGETPKELGLHRNYRVNVLAVHRSGEKIKNSVGDIRFKEGDIIIVQSYEDQLNRFLRIFGLLPLREGEFRLSGKKETAILSMAIFMTAIIVSIYAPFPVHLVFAVAALSMIIAKLIPFKEAGRSLDVSMIVVLAVMIQLGIVFESTGAASSLASFLFLLPNITPEISLAVIFIASIWLSDILNNVAVAVLLAPVAFSITSHLGVSFDPFLMAVAIGSGSSYLTPIGHQSNIFVMNMGGYKFTDYWKLGLPLEIITFAVGFPLILHFWPF